MATRVLRLAEVPPEEARAAFVATAAAGGPVIFPTDTVYGLGARADREAAARRVYEVKGRPAHLALPVLVGSVAGARRVAAEWPEAAQRLAAAFWPGPLTIVVRRREDLSPLVTGGADTVGVRQPDYAPLLEWLEACDFPLAVTSANPSGAAPAVRAEDLPGELVAAVDLVLDGGPCPGGIPSTVVDVTSPLPRVLRPGPISEQEIIDALANLN